MGDSFKEVSCWSQSSSENIVFQVQEETWLYYQEIQGLILCERVCSKETISLIPELVFSSGPVRHIDVDVDFAVYYVFAKSKYWLHKFISSGGYYKWGAIIH